MFARRRVASKVLSGRTLTLLSEKQIPPYVNTEKSNHSALSVQSSSLQNEKWFSTSCSAAAEPVKTISEVLVSLKRGERINQHIVDLNQHVIVRLEHNPDHGGTVANVSINNTRKLNSLNSKLIEDLTTAFQEINRESSLRCVILRGEHDASSSKSPSFSAGANLVEMSEIENSDDAEAFIRRVSALCSAIRSCPVPVTAAIDGHCYGAGLEVAASCDVRYATSISKFAMPEVKVGIPSVVEARLLADIIGWAHTRYLTLFGNTLDAAEAGRIGLVNQLFGTKEEMEQRIDGDVDTLMKAGPKAVRSQKSLITKWEKSGVDAGIEHGVTAFAEMWHDGGREPKAYLRQTLAELKVKKHEK